MLNTTQEVTSFYLYFGLRGAQIFAHYNCKFEF